MPKDGMKLPTVKPSNSYPMSYLSIPYMEEHRASTALAVVQLLIKSRHELGWGDANIGKEMLTLESNAIACLTQYLAIKPEEKADTPVTASATAL